MRKMRSRSFMAKLLVTYLVTLALVWRWLTRVSLWREHTESLAVLTKNSQVVLPPRLLQSTDATKLPRTNLSPHFSLQHTLPAVVVVEVNQDHSEELLDRNKIPRIVHFVFLSGMGNGKVSFLTYLAIRAAAMRLNPDAIFLHSDVVPPNNVNWLLARQLITKIVIWQEEINQKKIFGQKVFFDSHLTDLVRILALIKYGGIYLDTDMMVCRSLDHYMKDSKGAVMCKEDEGAVGSAGVIARRNSLFLFKWLSVYRTDYRPSNWSYNAVKTPARLAEEHPQLVTLLPPEIFFRPLWDEEGLREMYEEQDEEELFKFKENEGVHLWGALARAKYLNQLTAETIITKKTAANQILRPLLPHPMVTIRITLSPGIRTDEKLRDTMQSIFSQAFPLWEIIVQRDEKDSDSDFCRGILDRYSDSPTFLKRHPTDLRCGTGGDIRGNGIWELSLPAGRLLEKGDFTKILAMDENTDRNQKLVISEGIHGSFIFDDGRTLSS